MIKGLSLQELKDLLDAINHAYFRIDDITNWADCDDEEALYAQWDRLNKLEEKINETIKWL